MKLLCSLLNDCECHRPTTTSLRWPPRGDERTLPSLASILLCHGISSRSPELLENTDIQWKSLSQPRRTLCMVPLLLVLVICIRMKQCAQGTAVDDEPRNECTKLFWCEDVYFEHCDRMWSNRAIPYFIYAKFRDFRPRIRSLR